MAHTSMNDAYGHGIQEPQLSIHPQWVEEMELVIWENKSELVGAASRN